MNYSNSNENVVSSPQPIEFVREKSKTEKQFSITGRRIINIGHFWKQVQAIKHAPFFNCGIEHCEILKEKLSGFKSIIIIKCSMCGTETALDTDSSESELDVNSAAVLGRYTI